MERGVREWGSEIVRLPAVALARTEASASPALPCSIAVPALPAQLASALLGRRIEMEIDCCDLFQAQLRGQAPPVFDARVRRAFFAGRIPGAVHLPADQVSEAALAPFAEAAFVLVYGADSQRLDGVRTAHAIAELGVPVKLLSGGYAAWLAEGFPVEQPPAFVDRIAAI